MMLVDPLKVGLTLTCVLDRRMDILVHVPVSLVESGSRVLDYSSLDGSSGT